MTMISLFTNIMQVSNPANISLEDFYNNIIDGEWKTQIEGVRNGSVQKKALPYVTISGTFSHRKETGLIKHSCRICLDFDKLEDLDEVKNTLALDRYTEAVGISCSGKGLFVVVKINPDEHKHCFAYLEKYYLYKYNLKIDYLADFSRPRFISYDPEMFINWEAQELKPKIFEKKQKETIWETVEKHISQAGEGDKHKVLLKMAFLLGGFIAGNQITEFEAQNYLEEQINKKDIKSSKGALKTIRAGLTKGQSKPIYKTENAELTAITKPKEETEKKDNIWKFFELWSKKDLEQPFLIPDLLPSNGLALFIGEEGIGKTQLIKQLCLNIVLKDDQFLNMPLNSVNNKALFVATEDSKDDFIRSTAKQYKAYSDLEPDELTPVFDFIEGSSIEDYKTFISQIDKALTKTKYDITVIDALSDLFVYTDGEINSNSHARGILNPLQNLANKHNTLIIVVHHAAKSKMAAKRKENKVFVEKFDIQGAGAISQKPRTVLALSHDIMTNKNLFHCCKGNLIGKKYKENAVILELEESNLLHVVKGVTNINEYELSIDRERPLEAVKKSPVKMIAPHELSSEQNYNKLKDYFKNDEGNSKTNSIESIRYAYGFNGGQIGAKRAEGYFDYFIQKTILEKNEKGLFVLNYLPF